MADHTHLEPLDWQGLGYAQFTGPRAVREAHAQPSSPQDVVELAVAEARAGRFERIHQLPGLLANADMRLSSVIADILGDAGSARDLETLLPALEGEDFEAGLRAASALFARGRLLDVPAIFGFYEIHRERRDAEIVASWLDFLLSDREPLPASGPGAPWEAYRLAVARRYFTLVDTLGTNLVYVYRGAMFSLSRVVDRMTASVRDGHLSIFDRRLFEVTTGHPCSNWYVDGGLRLLRVAADLAAFRERGVIDRFHGGTRYFMGHPVEAAEAVGPLLTEYESNGGMGVPFVRTALDLDAAFALELGFDWGADGYFIQGAMPPPGAEMPTVGKAPWLTLHVSLREARSGRRDGLTRLAGMLGPHVDPMFQTSAVELLADAADDVLLESWRAQVQRGASADLTFDLCCGLLRRGILRDVPLVLAAYRRHAEHPDYAYLQTLLNWLFAFTPAVNRLVSPIAPVDACAAASSRGEQLRRRLGRDDVPIFRNDVFSVRAVAEEIVTLRHGPEITQDLRYRLEASTGIDCSGWARPGGGFDRETAAATARRLLASGELDRYEPGRLYFFGHPVEI